MPPPTISGSQPPFSCRVIPHLRGDGPTQMAIDEALLDSVADEGATVVVRTYEWSPATLSLGYFQQWSDAMSEGRWQSVPIVRRATGGGALWHDREVTYAVVIPRSHPLAHPSTALYQAVHAAIAADLGAHGLVAHRRSEMAGRAEPFLSDRPFLCFRDRDASDVMAGEVKVVGSAQRRRSGAVLQHGSLLLARSTVTPELPGLSDLAPELASDPAFWSRELRSTLVRLLGQGVEADIRGLTAEEQARVGRLRDECYASETWTRRR